MGSVAGELINIILSGIGATARTITLVDSNQTLAATDLVNTWGSGVRQTFSPSATTPGFNPGSFAGDPSTPANADVWYNSSTGALRARINGSTVTLGAATPPGGSSGTIQYNNAGAFGGITGSSVSGGAVTLASGSLTATNLIATSTGVFSLGYWFNTTGLATTFLGEYAEGEPAFTNAAQTSVAGLHLGPNTSGFVYLKRNGAGLSIRTGNDGADGTLTAANTILTTTVTTGTGATAGLQVTANSLTTGNGLEVSSSSVTTGNVAKIISTSTAAASNTLTGLAIAISGANASTAQTVTGQTISVTNTNGTSGTNVGLSITASGATTANYALLCTGGVGIGTSTPTNATFEVQNGSSSKYAFWLEGGGSSGSASMRLKSTSNSSNIVFEFQDGSAGQARIAAFNFLNTTGTTFGSFNFFYGTSVFDIRTRASNTASLTLNSSGNLQLNAYGAGTLTTDASGNVTATSDENLKHLRGAFKAGLDELKHLRPILYQWKKESGLDTESVYAGLGARNVRQYIPEAVGEMGGYFTILDRPIIAAVINALQEIDERLGKLEGKA